MFENKAIFISGGTGSWGQELTRQLLKQNPKRIVIYSRCEENQVDMQRTMADDRIQFVIGDVRDKEALNDAMFGVEYVFHAAALKHVPVCEAQGNEAIKTNILGTRNIIECSIKNKVKKFINISTDKVVDPANFYGLTKAIAEKLTIQANGKGTIFMNTRTGNVLGSNGSIVPYMISQIKSGKNIKVTSDKMVRFFLTQEQAIELLFYAMMYGNAGNTIIRDISAYRIIDLAELLKERYGTKKTKIEICGIREGEKVNESLISDYELPKTIQIDYIPVYYAIGNEYNIDTISEKITSENRLSTKEKLKELLKSGGLI